MPRGWGRGEVEEEGKGLKDPVVAEPDGFWAERAKPISRIHLN